MNWSLYWLKYFLDYGMWCIQYLQLAYSFINVMFEQCTFFWYLKFPFSYCRLYLQGTRTIVDNLDSGVGVLPVISKYEGVVDCFHTIVSEEGASGLYKGFGALLLDFALQMLIVKVAKVTFQEIEQLFRPSDIKKM